ncbi:toprim domain-containing protein [Spirosoma sp. KNUC1025]|uniref:toprim domain-containing protein n=1 Tax=Spirosoma sp. KNUC1025 TaxID=2894082 RepID=UPI00386DA687|nr:toprim domain-containing protein [Spirosoma sp. KNUC1025]
MNIDHAKAIPIAEILSLLKIQPRRVSGSKRLYLSPRRAEKTPSFWVYTKTNRWHDYGDGQGGDTVDLVCEYLKYTREEHTVSDALRWLKNMHIAPHAFPPLHTDTDHTDDTGLILKDRKSIQHLGLIHYLQKRGIPLELARQHLKEIHVRNKQTKKSFFALGLPNEEGGYELRNPFFKGCLGVKAITFKRGTDPKPNTINLFEGSMDYLSAASHLKDQRFKGDTVILNSLSCLSQISAYIQNYGYRTAYSWFDNDLAGEKATQAFAQFCQTQADLIHKPMNRIYAPHKDVNAWHMHQKGLVL